MISQLLAQVTARHDVSVVYLRHSQEPVADGFFRARCNVIEEVIRGPARASSVESVKRALRLLLSLVKQEPLWVSDWASKEFAARARSVARDSQPDLIQADYHVMGQYIPALADSHTPSLLVEYEPGIRGAPYLRTLPSAIADLIGILDRQSWRRYETHLFRQVNGIVVFTEGDRRITCRLARQTPVWVIPPGIPLPEHRLNPLGSPPESILFVANFMHPPNVDAARRLIQGIFPFVKQRFPGLQLLIVGDHPPTEIQRLATADILVTGRVPDVTPYLDRAALFVAPLHLGGGIRIKIQEALAAGKAVVTSPLGIQGMDLVDGVHVALADTDGEFAERIGALLQDQDKRSSLARNARAWACDHLGWDRAMRRYEAVYEELLDNAAHAAQFSPPHSGAVDV